jgi:ATP-binding cassette subfamily B protein
MLLTAVPLQALATFAGGLAGLDFGARLKQRLLSGALALDPDEPRRAGAGRLLSRVIESSEVEALSFSAALLGLTAAIELGASAWVMSRGAAGAWALLALGGHGAVTLALAAVVHRARREATRLRLDMTHDLIEQMAGHRTRLAQQAPERWHLEEDAALERYVHACRRVDRFEVALQAIAHRGWVLVGLLPLLPPLVRGGSSAADVAIGIGGLLLASQGWQRFSAAAQAASAAAIAWSSARSLFDAAARTETAPPPAALTSATAAPAGARPSAAAPAPAGNPEVLLEARDVTFRHAGRAEPVLRDASLRLASGDQVLLEGASGSGKSTLGALLTGLRQPSAGLLLLRGLDRPALGGVEWRRRVASAPQFHDNHILSGTLAFNLLMGRSWPPESADLVEAEAVCRALELGPLLERMPAGMLQTVGETGWQLSHGERSRVYLARALLQRSELTVLDESFGALDPATLQRALAATRERAKTLVLIAHP